MSPGILVWFPIAVTIVVSALIVGGMVTVNRLLGPRPPRDKINGPDAVMYGLPSRFGLGYRLSPPAARYGPNPHTFGHTGAGGSLGIADPTPASASAIR